MKIAFVAALALAVTAAQAQQTPEKPYGQEKHAGQAHGQKEVKVSSPAEWQFHKAEEKHKDADMQVTGDVQCAEPFGMKQGLVAKVAKLGAGARFKVTAKEDMYVHIHEGSVTFTETASKGAEQPGQERRFGQDAEQQRQAPGQADAGMKTARAGSLIYVPAGTTCWVSSTGETMAVVFTKHDAPTGGTESQEPKTDVK